MHGSAPCCTLDAPLGAPLGGSPGAPPGAPWGTAKSEKRRGTGAKTDGRTLTVNAEPKRCERAMEQ